MRLVRQDLGSLGDGAQNFRALKRLGAIYIDRGKCPLQSFVVGFSLPINRSQRLGSADPIEDALTHRRNRIIRTIEDAAEEPDEVIPRHEGIEQVERNGTNASRRRYC